MLPPVSAGFAAAFPVWVSTSTVSSLSVLAPLPTTAVDDQRTATAGVACRPEEGLAVLVRTLALCDTHGIVLIAFWVPRESNRVSDYLSHLSLILRSDVAGSFDEDASSALATAATGSWDSSATDALARSTGVDPLLMEEIIGDQGGRSLHGELGIQCHHNASLSDGLSARRPSARGLDLSVPGSAGDAKLGELPEHRGLQDGSPIGVCTAGGRLAVHGRSAPTGKLRQDSREGGLQPSPPEASPAGVHLQRVAALSDRSDPHHLLTLSPSGRGDCFGPDDGGRNDRRTALPWPCVSPDRPGLHGPVPGMTDDQCCLPDEGVVGSDGPSHGDNGQTLSKEVVRFPL